MWSWEPVLVFSVTSFKTLDMALCISGLELPPQYHNGSAQINYWWDLFRVLDKFSFLFGGRLQLCYHWHTSLCNLAHCLDEDFRKRKMRLLHNYIFQEFRKIYTLRVSVRLTGLTRNRHFENSELHDVWLSSYHKCYYLEWIIT